MNELQVIFGTGPLGRSVMRALRTRGYEHIRMVNRSGSRAEIPPGVEVVASDAYQEENVRQLTEGAAVVYQCAQPPYTAWEEQFPPLQTSILNGVAATGGKLIVGENLYMYGEVDGALHEDLPYAAHTRKGRVRAQMARQLIEAHEAGIVRVAMGRGSDFYGPRVRESTFGEGVFERLLAGKPAQLLGDPDLPHTYTVIDDFGAALVTLGEEDEALGQAWHVPNPPTRTSRELIEMAAGILGVEPRIATVGSFMVRVGGIFSPVIRETVEMMYEFEKPFIVDHSKFTEAFGGQATPHEEALRSTIAWYRRSLQPA